MQPRARGAGTPASPAPGGIWARDPRADRRDRPRFRTAADVRRTPAGLHPTDPGVVPTDRGEVPTRADDFRSDPDGAQTGADELRSDSDGFPTRPDDISVREQIQGLKERPDLAHEVPVSVAKLEAEAAELETLRGRHKDVGTLYHKLTQFLQERAFRLRESFNSNTLAVGSKYGKYAPELRVVGAEPLGRARGRGKTSAEAAPAVPAVDDATVEKADAADTKAA